VVEREQPGPRALLGRLRDVLRGTARRLGGRTDPLARCIPHDARVVVVVTDAPHRARALDVLAASRASVRLVVVVGKRQPRTRVGGVSVVGVPGDRALHRELVAVGHVDAVVMLRAGGLDGQRRYWVRTFFHLSDGGCYVAPRGGSAEVETSLVAYWQGLADGSVPSGRRHRQLARTVSSVSTEAGAVVVTRRGSNLVKLREKEAARLIPCRTDRLEVTVVDRRDGGVLGPNRVNTSWPESAEHLADELAYPPAFLRR